MKNHGTRTLRGLTPVSSTSSISIAERSTAREINAGRFQRLFPLSTFNPSDPDRIFTEVGKRRGPMDGGSTPDSTLNVPLGLIYLGQFIDHDITLDVTSSLDAINDPAATINFRTPALDLDCVYGNGPEASAHLFYNGGFLCTGADGTAYVQQPVNLKANDLSRNFAGVAIIGDPRNDENRVISQLQLAFLRFHNAVMKKIEANDPHIMSLILPDLDERADHPFEFAQRLVRWHYQWIINNEFLPILCGQSLVDLILETDTNVQDRGRKIYDPNDEQTRAFIPIEFAVAAYRFGHSMIAQTVKVGDNPLEVKSLFGRTLGRGFTPLEDRDGIMNWKFLFDIDGSNFQRADRLDTTLATTLLDLPFANPASLAFRNLKRGLSFQLPSGEEVVNAINARLSTPISAVPAGRISAFSGGHFGSGEFIGNTPLWFYILAEASATSNGEQLGPVGARIVAETLLGIQQKDSTSYLAYNARTGNNWTPGLLQGSNTFSMANLLTYA